MSIVVGYTPSAQGEAALAAGMRQARLLGCDLVIASHAYAGPGGTTAAADEPRVLEAIAANGGHEPPARVLVDSRRDAGEFLLEVVEQESPRLLVIGLRRKSPIGKLSLGASARRVVLGAPCPVLAVKEPTADASGPVR